MATVAKTTITADTSALVDTQTADAGDVEVPILDNRDNIREGRVAAIGTATHVGTLDDVITVTAPVTKSVTSPTGDARLNLDVDDMTGATGVAAGAAGLVPQPSAGDDGKFLRGDGTWVAAAGSGTVTSIATGLGLTTNTGSAITASGTIYPDLPSLCGVRLSLENNVAVPTSDLSAQSSLYVVPMLHEYVALYDGSRWNLVAAIGTASFSLAVLSASTLYDIFAYDDGAVELEFVAWTSSGFGSSSRATALTTQDGVLVKTGATTRRYMGTIYIDSSGGQAFDTAARRDLWNAYNRVPRRLRRVDSTNSWVYSTATWRALNNSTGNRVQFVQGLLREKVMLDHYGYATGGFGTVGIDLNAATDGFTGCDVVVGGNTALSFARYNDLAAVGLNYLQLMEFGAATTTFNGDSGVGYFQAGGSGEVWC